MKVKVQAIMRETDGRAALAITDKNEIYYYAYLFNSEGWRKVPHQTTEDGLFHWQNQLRTARPVLYGNLTIDVKDAYEQANEDLRKAFAELNKHIHEALQPGGSLYMFKR